MLTESVHYNCYCVKNWEELMKEYERFLAQAQSDSVWIYRGEAQDYGKISTSLDRAMEKFDHRPDDRIKMESRILREFKRRLHHYTMDVPHEDDIVEWLALMQHYGAPTRLLDWTYSFYVALYFAIERAKKNVPCIVWALNKKPFYFSKDDLSNLSNFFDTQEEQTIQDILNSPTESSEDALWHNQSEIVQFLYGYPKPLVYSVNPFRLNERLTIQQGCFLLQGDISKSFEDNLTIYSDLKTHFSRFEITVDDRSRIEILRNLHRMNINRATLFPGLVGFAESLGIRLAFSEIMSGAD